MKMAKPLMILENVGTAIFIIVWMVLMLVLVIFLG